MVGLEFRGQAVVFRGFTVLGSWSVVHGGFVVFRVFAVLPVVHGRFRV